MRGVRGGVSDLEPLLAQGSWERRLTLAGQDSCRDSGRVGVSEGLSPSQCLHQEVISLYCRIQDPGHKSTSRAVCSGSDRVHCVVPTGKQGLCPSLNLQSVCMPGGQGREFPARPSFSSVPRTPGSGCLNSSSGPAHRREASCCDSGQPFLLSWEQLACCA